MDNQNKQLLDDFIKDYQQILNDNKMGLDDIVSEIHNIITITPEFQGSGMTVDDISNVITNTVKNIPKQKNTDTMNDGITKNMGVIGDRLVSGIKEGTKESIDYTKTQTGFILGDVDEILSPISSVIANGFSGFDETIDYTKTQTDFILGETKEILSPIMGIGMGIKGLFGSLSDDTIDKGTEQTNNILDDINTALDDTYNIQKDQFLINQRKDGDTDKSKDGMSWLKKMGIIGVLGLLTGATVGAFLLPFKVIGNVLQKLPVIGTTIEKSILFIKNFFMSLFTKSTSLLGMVKNIIFGKIKTFLTGLETGGVFFTKVFASFEKVMFVVGKIGGIFNLLFSKFSFFIKMFKIGFAKLALPLQIILSIFDFISGFMNSVEKTFIGKFKDGIKNVLFKFLEMPVRFLGWLVEKLSFGLITDGGDKFVAGLKWLIDKTIGMIMLPFEIIDTIGKWVWGKISTVVGWIYERFEDIYDIVMTGIDFVVNTIKGGLKFLWEYNPIMLVFKAWKWVYTKISGFISENVTKLVTWIKSLPLFEKIMAFIEPITEFFGMVGTFVGKVVDWARKQLTKIPIIGRLFTSDQEKTDQDKSSVNESEQKIRDIKQTRQKLLDKQKNGEDLSRFEKRTLKRSNKTIKKEQENIDELNKDINDRKQKSLKDTTNKQTKEMFDSGIALDDWGANKIVDTKRLGEQYTVEELQNIKQKGNWEDDSLQKIQDVINKKVQEQTKTTITVNGMSASEQEYDNFSKSGRSGTSTYLRKYTKEDTRKEKEKEEKEKVYQDRNDRFIKPLFTKSVYKPEKKGLFSIIKDKLSLNKSFPESKAMKSDSFSPVKQSSLELPDVVVSKANMKKKQIESQNQLNNTINKNMKDMNNNMVASNDRPIVVNNQTNNKSNEPPEDIESMSILWLNKSYGLG